MRDFFLGKPSKDLDVFFVNKESWEGFSDSLGESFEELRTNGMKKMCVRKFRVGESVVDAVLFKNVTQSRHIVDTFDFTINMLWLDPESLELRGSSRYSADEILQHIREKMLIPGESLWFKGNLHRYLRRYERFRSEGYSMTDEDKVKFKQTLILLTTRRI